MQRTRRIRGRRRLVVGVVGTVLAGMALAACGAETGDEDAAQGSALEAPGDGADEADGIGEPPESVEGEARDGAEEAVSEEVADQPAPELRVVATVAPVADLVQRVGGERVEVEPLVPAGGDAHTYEPRPQDVVLLSEADAYLGIGFGLNEAALRLAEENLREGAPLFLLAEAGLSDADLVLDHTHDEDDETHGDDDHSHDEDDETHGDVGHTHGEDSHTHDDDDPGPNPHVWTSVRNAAVLVEEIVSALSEIDPDGAETYAANAEGYQQELAELDEAIEEATATIPDEHRTLVTYHDAWSYFARDYDLAYAQAVQPADFSEPSAAEVRAVIDLIRELDVPVVFGSEVFPTPVLETIAGETGATYVADLADDVLPGQPGSPEHSYVELMRGNAKVIVDALGGDTASLN